MNEDTRVNHPSYYARINKPMPSDVFKSVNELLKGKNGEVINWFKYI